MRISSFIGLATRSTRRVAGPSGTLRRATLWMALLLTAALPPVANAVQPDAEFRARHQQLGRQWDMEDR